MRDLLGGSRILLINAPYSTNMDSAENKAQRLRVRHSLAICG